MAKEVIITTSGLNCYGSRVLTEGCDLTQYRRNPVLLWMHRRSFEGNAMPIGRMDNLRIDGDKLIGTPVFDEADEFAKKIADKWESGFLRMASAGIEIMEVSDDPSLMLPGQTRPTITKCRLEEVSIVDIGGNDEALQLYKDGQRLELCKGGIDLSLPVVKEESNAEGQEAPEAKLNHNFNNKMNKETLQLLGLSETATEQEQHEAIKLLKEKADKADRMELAGVNAAIDAAIADKRITETQRGHFAKIGKSVGVEALRETLSMMRPAQKPSAVVKPENPEKEDEPKKFAKLSEVPEEEREKLRENDPREYVRLYKAEYGVECKI